MEHTLRHSRSHGDADPCRCLALSGGGRGGRGSSRLPGPGGGGPARPPPRRSSINQALIVSTLPMSALVVPMRASLFPTIWNPVIAAALADPTSGNPDVLMPAPLPKSRRPDVSDAWRRHGLDANRRGGPIDIEGHACGR